jgi:hypothetical protein
MARQKRETISRTTRLIAEIAEALQEYADTQLISENAAINQLLKEALTAKGFLKVNEADIKDKE